MAGSVDRKMLLVGFLQASNCSNYTGSWRHPDTDPGFMDLGFYQNIAATLERGKFHLAFIDDRLAMPSRYGDSFEEAVENGIRVIKLDLVPIITAMGLATKHLGLGATYSTTYYSPFHVARLFASLDHFTKRRVAWNVVTSLNDSEAQNFGVREQPEHDDRYDAADDFMQAACKLWDSWEDGAVLLDKQTGRFADPAKVHRVDHAGEWFQVRGPRAGPRPPQGRVISTPIGLVALVDAPRLFLNFGHIRLASMILEQPAPGALLEAGDKKNFYVRVGENHGTHIPSVGHEVTVSSHAALYVEQPITNGG